MILCAGFVSGLKDIHIHSPQANSALSTVVRQRMVFQVALKICNTFPGLVRQQTQHMSHNDIKLLISILCPTCLCTAEESLVCNNNFYLFTDPSIHQFGKESLYSHCMPTYTKIDAILLDQPI